MKSRRRETWRKEITDASGAFWEDFFFLFLPLSGRSRHTSLSADPPAAFPPSLPWSLFVFIVPVPRRWPHRQKVIPRAVAATKGGRTGTSAAAQTEGGRERRRTRCQIIDCKKPRDGRKDGQTDMRDGSKEGEGATRRKKRRGEREEESSENEAPSPIREDRRR